jgi:hypothetical protein
MRDYPDDPQRLTRLAEEVQARLEEIAQIAARIAGVKLDPGTVRKYVPCPASEAGEDRGLDHGTGVLTMVEILDASGGNPEMCVGWYSDGTVSLDSPCGTEIYHSTH